MSSIWTLRRSATDHKASGLCGGLAEHWNVDSVLVRVGAVVLALSGGIGIVLYAAGWLLIPVAGQEKAPIDDLLGEQARKIPREAWIVIVAVVCFGFFASLGAVTPFGLGPVLILAAVWYFGFYRKQSRRDGAATAPHPESLQPPMQDSVGDPFAGPPTPFTEAARAWQARVAAYERARAEQPDTGAAAAAPDSGGQFTTYPYRAPAPGAGPDPATPPQPGTGTGPASPAGASNTPGAAPLPTAPPPPEVAFFSAPDPVGLYAEPAPVAVAANAETVARRRDSTGARRLRLVSLITLGLALAGLGVASSLGVTVPVLAWLATALLVVSLTLIAGAYVGRPRGTMALAIVLAVSVVCTGLAGLAVQHDGPIAPYSVRYTSLAAMPADQVRDAGALEVDLAAVDVTDDQEFTTGVDLGTVHLVIPEDENVIINYSVDIGSATVLDRADSGADLTGTVEHLVDKDEPVLTINTHVDAGSVTVVSR